MEELSVEQQFQRIASRYAELENFRQQIEKMNSLELREKLMSMAETSLMLEDENQWLRKSLFDAFNQLEKMTAEKIGFTDYHKYKKVQNYDEI